MKRSILTGALVVLLGSGALFAQESSPSVKVGHTSSTYILTQLPETKKAQSELETVGKQLEKVIEEKSKAFEEKVQRYQSTGASMSQQVRESSEAELQKLRTELEELQQKSQQSFAEKQESLFKPLIEKVNKTIAEVGKEQGYMYIINNDTGTVGNPIILYSGSKETDITNLVLKKLGAPVSN